MKPSSLVACTRVIGAFSFFVLVSTFGADTARVLVPKRSSTSVPKVGRGGSFSGFGAETLIYKVDDLAAQGEVSRLPDGKKAKAELAKKFASTLEANTIEVYKAEAVDKKLKAIDDQLKSEVKKSADSLSATEDRLTKLIVNSSQTVPADVFSSLKQQAAEQVRQEMKAEIDDLKAQIAELKAALPLPAPTPVPSPAPAPGQ